MGYRRRLCERTRKDELLYTVYPVQDAAIAACRSSTHKDKGIANPQSFPAKLFRYPLFFQIITYLIIKGKLVNKTKIVGTKRCEIKAVCTIKNDGQFVRVSSYNTNLMNVMAKLKLGKIHNISGVVKINSYIDSSGYPKSSISLFPDTINEYQQSENLYAKFALTKYAINNYWDDEKVKRECPLLKLQEMLHSQVILLYLDASARPVMKFKMEPVRLEMIRKQESSMGRYDESEKNSIWSDLDAYRITKRRRVDESIRVSDNNNDVAEDTQMDPPPSSDEHSPQEKPPQDNYNNT